MEIFFQKIAVVISSIALFVGSIFGIGEKPVEPVQPQEQVQVLQSNLGPTFGAAIPGVVAKFETSLATKINSSATSMTLVKGTDAAGNALAGYKCFVLDEGKTSEEFVCGTSSSTSVTSMIRGIDPIDGDLEVTALKLTHRRGATVKITDHPSLSIALRILNGDETLPNLIKYDATTTPTLDTQLVHKFYVDSLTAAGVSAITESVAGIGILATQEEMAAGTPTSSYSGVDYNLLAQNRYFNQTSTGTTTPVAEADGDLNVGWIPLDADYDWTGGQTSSGRSTSTGPFTVSGAVTTLSTTTVNGVDVGSSLFKPYGDGRDGASTISSTSTLTSDKFYTNLTVNAGITLNTGGYRIYVNGTLTNNGIIANNGGDGGDASGLTKGTAGTAASGGTLAAGLAGGAGGNGVGSNNNGGAGSTGATSTPGLGGDGVAGGSGGGGCNTAGKSPGAVGGFGTAVLENLSLVTGYGTSTLARDATSTINFASYFSGASSTFGLSSSGGSGGGSGGCSDTSGGNSGAGGGSGGTGGLVYVIAKTLVNNGTIEALGGDGGDASDATGGDAAGGGGGSGGASGVIMLGYNSYSGSGTISIAISSAGIKGTGTGGATDGNDGSAGNLGVIFRALIKP